MLRWFLVALMFCPFWLQAQKRPARKPAPKPPASAPIAWPIEAIEVEGNNEHSREQILAVTGLRVGQTVTPKDIEAARERLAATGAFESIGFKFGPSAGGKGYVITFQVAEVGPLFPIRFEDLPAKPDELMAALKRADPLFERKMPATEKALARYTKVLQEYLATRNYKEAIEGKLLPDDAGQLAVTFHPAAPLPVVARVTFSGNEAVQRWALENAINGVAIGMPYKETRFRQALDANVRPLYEARGRVRVAFSEIHTEQDKEVKGLVVAVKVDEGASYSLGKVRVDGAGPEDELLKAGEFKSGGVFNIEQLQAGVARIEKVVRRGGYMHVRSRLDRTVNDKDKTVDLVIHVERGPQYHFGKLTIQGLDLITEPAIRKMWSMQPGQPFNADYPDYFLNRVREDGVLDNLGDTRSKVDTNDDTRTVDVTLLFKGETPKPKERKW